MTKPTVNKNVIGENAFLIIGMARSALRRAGKHDESNEMSNRCLRAGSYENLIEICKEYVDFVNVNGDEEDGEEDE